MSTDVLLISADRPQLLRRSLAAALAQAGADVLVVDAGRSDETAAVAREQGVEVLRVGPASWAAANNAALAATGGDEVLLLNDDCFLAPDFLVVARARLREPGVGAVAPKLLRAAAGRPEHRRDEIDAAGMILDRRRKNTLVGHGRPGREFASAGEAFGPDGAAALYRREALVDCAPDGEVLDEDMGTYASDVDLAWRARLLGWRCAYEPRAVAWHVRSYGPSSRPRVPEPDRRAQFRNRYLMMLKNDTAGGLARDLHHVVLWEALALGHALLRERHLLRAYRDAWRLAPAARRRRRAIQARRRVRRVPFGLAPPA